MNYNWLDNFKRQAKLVRALVLSGNTSDLFYDEYEQVTQLKPLLESQLKALGFRQFVYFSTASGVTGISAEEWNELANTGMHVEGDDYDFDDEDESENPQQGETGVVQVDAPTFFAVAERVMTKSPAKVAFIVDWSNYIFGQMNALSDLERNLVIRIANSLRDAELPRTPEQMKSVQSLIIFISTNAGALPPSLYLNNPMFAEINIPLPNIQERTEAILNNSVRFRVNADLSRNSKDLDNFATQTDGLNIRDLYKIQRLSQTHEDKLNINNLISLYRFGKAESPWEKLNKDRLKATTEILKRRVKGQDQAIEAVRKILIRAYTGLSGLQHSAKARTPKGALFFVGPTGVGKTELAKSLAEFLFGDEDACIRFDMSEFNHEHADQRLVGAPPGYVGYEEGGQLTNAIKAKPFSLLLFDEIEKAHPRILDKFLQILEDGRLTDGKGETISFADTFIVFTSNIGAATIVPGTPEENAAQFKAAVSEHFRTQLNRPEILGRIGEANIIPFNFMTDVEILKQIARAKITPIINHLKEKWAIADLSYSEEVIDFIVQKVNRQSGGRGVLNVITKEFLDPLADFIFENTEALRGNEIIAKISNNQIIFI